MGIMSEIATTIDAAQELANWCRRVTGMYAKDLKALTQSAYDKPFGEKTRTAHDVTAEVSGLNMVMVSIINGTFTGMPSEESRDGHKASLATLHDGVQAILASGEALASAIESGGDKLNGMTQAPWGEAMTVFQLATVAVNHILYHDGQLNFLQCLHGDDTMHWFDE